MLLCLNTQLYNSKVEEAPVKLEVMHDTFQNTSCDIVEWGFTPHLCVGDSESPY